MKHLWIAVLVALFGYCSHGAPIDLNLCIVYDNRNQPTITQAGFESLVTEVNRIFRQVAMSFRAGECIVTNDSSFVSIDSNNLTGSIGLFDALDGSSGIKVFFVPELIDAAAFQCSKGIVVGQGYSARVLAHELGHACGLDDIYDVYDGVEYEVNGAIRRAWVPLDWGDYRTVSDQAELVQQLLMYGYDSGTGVDITFGDVYGLWYSEFEDSSGESNVVWHMSLAPVGFHHHGNRNPTCR